MNLKFILTILSILILAFTSNAQTSEPSGMVKTAAGVMFVSNEPGDYYTIEVKGEKVDPVANRTMFNVDGRFLQVLTVPQKQFLNLSVPRRFEDREILTAHRDWEADYIAKSLTAKLKVYSEWMKLANGTEVLFWSYDMPQVDAKQTAKKQLYLSVVKRGQVLLLNSTVEGKDDEKPYIKLLVETMNTLKSTDKPRSLKDVQAEVLKSTQE